MLVFAFDYFLSLTSRIYDRTYGDDGRKVVNHSGKKIKKHYIKGKLIYFNIITKNAIFL